MLSPTTCTTHRRRMVLPIPLGDVTESNFISAPEMSAIKASVQVLSTIGNCVLLTG